MSDSPGTGEVYGRTLAEKAGEDRGGRQGRCVRLETELRRFVLSADGGRPTWLLPVLCGAGGAFLNSRLIDLGLSGLQSFLAVVGLAVVVALGVLQVQKRRR